MGSHILVAQMRHAAVCSRYQLRGQSIAPAPKRRLACVMDDDHSLDAACKRVQHHQMLQSIGSPAASVEYHSRLLDRD